MAKKKTQLSSGANSTPQRPYGSGYVQPTVPRWGGAWDAANMMTPNMVSANTTPYFGEQLNNGIGFTVPLWQNIRMFEEPSEPSTNTIPTYEGPMPTRDKSKTVNPNSLLDYPGQTLAGDEAEIAAYNQSKLDLTQPAAPAGQPRYDVDAYGNPVDPYWYQNNANRMQMVFNNGKWEYAPRPGVPEAYAMEDYASMQAWEAEHDGQPWTSSYSPEYYKNAYLPRFTTASYGADGQKRKAVPRDPYSFKSRQGVNNTNKHRGAPPDGMETQQLARAGGAEVLDR